MNKRREHTRRIQKRLASEYRRRAFIERLTGDAACWLPIIYAAYLILCVPKGSVPFVKRTIGGKVLAGFALATIAPWGLWQMASEKEVKPADRWLQNILPVECVLWLVYCRIQHDCAVAFFAVGIAGIAIALISRKKNRYRFAAIVMAIALAIPSWQAVLKTKSTLGVMAGRIYASVTKQGQTWTEENTDGKSVPQCCDEEWETLNTQEKMELLRQIVKCETAYMGIPDILVCLENLKSDKAPWTLGEYDTYRNEIVMDSTHLERGSYIKCLSTVLHECRHAMQLHVIEHLLDWEDEAVQTHAFYEPARQWRASFKSGKDESLEEYYWDPAEVDARNYAEDRIHVYYRVE